MGESEEPLSATVIEFPGQNYEGCQQRVGREKSAVDWRGMLRYVEIEEGTNSVIPRDKRICNRKQ